MMRRQSATPPVSDKLRSLQQFSGLTPGFVNNKSLFSEGDCFGSKYRVGTGQRTEVQEQCKQHMPTKGATEHSAVAEQKKSVGAG